MYSSIKELITKLESEKQRLKVSFEDFINYSHLRDYEEVEYNNQYNEVNGSLSDLIEMIKKQLNDELLSDNVTEKYKKLRDNWLKGISDCYGKDIHTYESNLPQILEDFKIIKLFSFIAKIDSTTVIIGANGAGKTSLINELRKNSIDEMYVLPAQKLLYFVLKIHDRNEITRERYIQDLKEVDLKYETIDLYPTKIENDFSNTFTKLITLLVKDYTNIVTRRSRKEKNLPLTLLDRVEQIWNQIFPEITFNLEPDDRVVNVEKNSSKYSINGLSDGERCILFYIGNVLLAPKNSYIVVDEPETFLNAAVYNELWDLLISERSDCQFVFASHNMDFVQSRTNASYIWCKKFEAPFDLEYQVLEGTQEMPLFLLTEVSGTKKPILFCEGTKTSIDYQIYSKLFSEWCFVKPVEGHKQVIQHTKAYNNLNKMHGNKAYGIIDDDWMEKARIEKYKKNNIFVLPLNEIEMLLVDEAIVKTVLESDDQDKEKKFNKFQEATINSCIKNKDKIISIALKKKLDEFMEGHFIEKNKPTKHDAQEFLEGLVTRFDVTSTVENITSIVEKALVSSNFSSILKICNLKKEIINQLGDTVITHNFKNKALSRIATDSELQNILRTKYFSELVTLLSHK